MRSDAKGYVLKEYGSWSVLTVAFLTGTLVSRAWDWRLVPLFLGLALLINSKQAFMKWLRRTTDRTAMAVFLSQVAVAGVLLLALFGSDTTRLLPLLVFPAAYLLSNKLAGEHFILTELLGFALLSLATVLAKFVLTNGLDVRLFVGVSLYFTAGVFKVKSLLLKRTTDRIGTIAYAVFALYGYHRMHLPLIILLPLVDTIIAAVTLYKVKLQTTGWIEVGKSVLFMTLFVLHY